MAERLLDRAVRERLTKLDAAPPADELMHSHSAGTGGWHAGEEMNPPAARQVRSRGGDPNGFVARKLRSDLIDAADLVLTATADQQEYVVALRPDASGRTFVLGEFGRLLGTVDLAALPAAGFAPDEVYSRGVALVEAVNTARGTSPALPADDLDDPWGRGDQAFTRVADEIEDTVDPLARALMPEAPASA